MSGLKKKFKNILHKSDFKFFDKILKKRNLIKSFPRYNIINSENSVLGWVPYFKNKTKISVFNFFSINYAIRKKLNGNIFLIKDLIVIDQLKFTIEPEEILEFDLEDVFKKKEGNSIVVQLTSKEFKYNHGGHDGHLRFWGKYYDKSGNLTSITHSMPIAFNDLFVKKEIFSRNYSLYKKNFELINSFPGQVCSKQQQSEYAFYGYNTIVNEDKDPVSIWHLSPLNKSKDKIGKIMQGFFCPDVKGIDPFIILDTNETGVQNNYIEVIIFKNKKLLNQITFEIKGTLKKQVSEIFDEVILPPYECYIKYYSLPNSHAHVHYAFKDLICDQVHMHDINWNIENGRLIPLENTKKRNCRKFFHFEFENNDIENFAIIHSEKIKNLEFSNLKIRLIQNEKEEVTNMKIYPSKPIKVINLNKIFNSIKNQKSAIQIESYDYNFHATGLILNKNNGYIATDHFTGG